ncbi:MAG: hypothetical protein ACREAQ_06170 [Nitrososphaera sp.]
MTLDRQEMRMAWSGRGSLAEPGLQPGQQGKGGQRQEKGQRKVVSIPQLFGAEATHGPGQSPGEGEEGREEGVLDRGVLLLADIHEEGEKGRCPEPTGEGLKD